MTTKLDDIVKFLDTYLNTKGVEDPWKLNGLIVEGNGEVEKIMLAVDSSAETFERAVKEKANLIIVHHGLFSVSSKPIADIMKKRIKILLDNGISLYGAHLPLDAHPEVGNNAQFFKQMGIPIKEPFFKIGQHAVGFVGELEVGQNINSISQKIENLLDTKCKVYNFGKQEIKTVAFSSGASGGLVEEAVRRNVDLFVGGDTRLEEFILAKEAKLNFIDAGHHTTETLGVKALEKVLNEKFGIDAKFIDIPTMI